VAGSDPGVAEVGLAVMSQSPREACFQSECVGRLLREADARRLDIGIPLHRAAHDGQRLVLGGGNGDL